MGGVEASLLDILSYNNEVYQSELVKRSGFSRSRVSEVLSAMERKGIVSRSPLGIGKNFKVVLQSKPKNVRHAKRRKKSISIGFTRAAEYPFVIPFRKLLKNKLDLDLDIRIYENGIDVTRNLSQFRLDLGISPVLTQFMFYSLNSPFRIIAPAGSGGSSLLVSKGRRMDREKWSADNQFRIASTKISTMELLMRSSLNEDVIPKWSSVTYVSSPNQMMKDIASRQVDATCMWEPYTTILLTKKREEFSRLIRYSDFGEHLCCGLAAGNHLDDSLLERVRRLFLLAVEQYSLNQDSFSAPYATLTGFSHKLIDTASNEYSYPMELDPSMISRQFERAGLSVPAPFSVKDAIWPAG